MGLAKEISITQFRQHTPDTTWVFDGNGDAILVKDHWRGAWNASGNTVPVDADTVGSGVGGAIRAGDQFYFSVGGTFDPDGTGSDVWPAKTVITAKQNSPTDASHYLFR